MQKIHNKDYQEIYYTKTLESGLQVILFSKPRFHNNFFTLITPYGAGDYQQIDTEGNKYHLPPGVAHFLEHRMFDYKDHDVMEEFVQYGASSNASTGYDQTQYYFSTTNDDYFKPLDLLLNFVFELEIPEPTVEKEKGIIVEELMMYDNMPDFKLYFGVLKNLYHNLPYIEDLGGSVESVNATTLEDLELAYKLNYHPSSMFLVGCINGDVEETFDFIENNMKQKTFNDYVKLSRDFESEPDTVSLDYEEVSMDINKSKVALGYKFKHKYTDRNDIDKVDNLLKIFFDLLFTFVNEDYQQWLDQKLINDYFDIDINVDENIGHFIVSGESEDVEAFTNFSESVIKNYEDYITEETFLQLKKKMLGRAIIALEQPSSIALVYGRSIAAKSNIFTNLEGLKNITYNDLLNLLSEIDLLSNKSAFVIKRKQ